MNNLPTAIDDSAVLFADDLKMVLILSVLVKAVALLPFSCLGLANLSGSANEPQCLPLISLPFSVASSCYSIPPIVYVRGLWVSQDPAFSISVHCCYAANTAR